MQLMSNRDENSMVGTVNGEFKGANEMGFKTIIKGNVAFNKQTSRKPMVIEDCGKAPGAITPSIYSYVDKVMFAHEKFKA